MTSSYLSVCKQRQIEKAGLRGLLQRRQIVLRVWPQGEIAGVRVVRVAERIAQRIGKLNALTADLLAVEPLDEQIGRVLVLAGRGNRQSKARGEFGMSARRQRIADLARDLVVFGTQFSAFSSVP